MSQVLYAGTDERVLHGGYILIPEYAKEFIGEDKLIIKESMDPFVFSIYLNESSEYDKLDVKVLGGLLMSLYNKEDISLTFKDCLMNTTRVPQENTDLMNLQIKGVEALYPLIYGTKENRWTKEKAELPYAIKIVKRHEEQLNYETCHKSSAWLMIP